MVIHITRYVADDCFLCPYEQFVEADYICLVERVGNVVIRL